MGLGLGLGLGLGWVRVRVMAYGSRKRPCGAKSCGCELSTKESRDEPDLSVEGTAE